jgi:F-box interacting protein
LIKMLRSRKKRRRSMEFSTRRKMLILPQELIVEILSLLPVESLVRFQSVSKAWFSLINNPYFKKMHLHTNRQRILIGEERKYWAAANRWPEEYYLVNISNEDRLGNPVKIFPPFYRPETIQYRTSLIGSCKGLVCILFVCNGQYGSHYEIVIWNPSIRKHKRVPFEPVGDKHKQGVRLNSLNLAFWYDPVNTDYKVLRIVKFDDLESKTRSLEEVKVYSLKAHSWRRIEDQLPYKEPFMISCAQSVFTNGAFHWLVMSATGKTLLAFNLTTEKFGVQTLPFTLHSYDNLMVLEGSLCVSASTYYRHEQHIDVWMMKEYGVMSSWSQLCTVPMTFFRTFFYRQSLVFSKDGKKILMEDAKDNKLFWYDIKKKTRTSVEHFSDKYYWTTTCGESLFLLDGDSDNRIQCIT